MRDYAKVSPQFWIGRTGKELRKLGTEAQVVAFYLMTSPHANMIGLYYIPKSFIAHETGLTIEGASKALRRACEAGFCSYDDTSEVVWVHEMAIYQVGEQLSPKDKQCKGVQNLYDTLPENPYLKPFFEKYSFRFCMKTVRDFVSPIEAPSKPLRSQEKEQEKEQEQEKGSREPPAALVPVKPPEKPKTEGQVIEAEPAEESTHQAKCRRTWGTYEAAYLNRYGTAPVRNARVNSLIKQFVLRLGDEAEPVIAFYVDHAARWYVQIAHSLEGAVKDAEKLRMEWATNRRITTASAANADRLQAAGEALGDYLGKLEAVQ